MMRMKRSLYASQGDSTTIDIWMEAVLMALTSQVTESEAAREIMKLEIFFLLCQNH
jgi:hypothetical protein